LQQEKAYIANEELTFCAFKTLFVQHLPHRAKAIAIGQ
jgi:hypothetical protein